MNPRWMNAFALVAVALAAALVVFGNLGADSANQLLNVSYDATRELYKDLDSRFIARYQKDFGKTLTIRQSHGESANQASAVLAGLKADVVTLALDSDLGPLEAHGLIAPGWQRRLPHHSQPYSSTIVFVVRKGNPKQVTDWPDLIKPGVSVVTSIPTGSGNGKLGLLAAWGSVTARGGDDAHALQFLRRLLPHLVVLSAGARGASKTFSEQKLGDVQLTWENEALFEADRSQGELQVVYPPVSIQAEPSVAWVDADLAGTRREAYAKAYLQFLFTPEGQEIIAQHDLRPIDGAVMRKHAARLRPLQLFPVGAVAAHWKDIQALPL